LPLDNKRARQALNLAVDRDRLVREAMFGWAAPLVGLTPPTAITFLQRFPNRLSPYRHDPRLAGLFWREVGAASYSGRPLRIAALGDKLERVA
jgi:ABC-type transport system substrate-binding protein